jgi:NAD+ synthase (glutamine-hydrolysing)
MAQINLCVGDISGNLQKIMDAALRARDEFQAELVIFPELTLTGYPPEDLLLRPSFLEAVEQAVNELAASIAGVRVLVGYPVRNQGKLYNAAGILGDGKVHVEYFKQALPNYSVFDEKRYFTAGKEAVVFNDRGVNFAITICEDIWENEPVEMAARAGAKVILNLNASPFDSGKRSQREALLQTQALKHGISIVYVNLVGGQDELVFDGGSMAVREDGRIVYRAEFFQEVLVPVNCDLEVRGRPLVPFSEEKISLIHRALVMGIRDYVQKNGFQGAVLGLSGGIDSALVLALAVEALGADQVEVLSMPSRYTSDMSNEDALQQARSLGVKHASIPIETPFSAFMELLSPEFRGLESDTTEENIQARCRGILLMAISNKKGKILLTTGNKSEMSVGYATLYGDMAGGFAPIKDCPKMLVYELARYCNRDAEVIPQRVIDRPPSAELRPDQKDTDSLPDYAILDEILQLYVEQDASAKNIIEMGFQEETVRRIIRLVDINEYKRRQAPPGVKITQRAYGRDRRYPMTNRFRSDML